MQPTPLIEVAKFGETKRTHECKHGTEDHQYGECDIYPERHHLTISPRSKNFDITTVPIKPSMAITSAASKKTLDADTMPNNRVIASVLI
jgi:hypothetical protein